MMDCSGTILFKGACTLFKFLWNKKGCGKSVYIIGNDKNDVIGICTQLFPFEQFIQLLRMKYTRITATVTVVALR